MSDNRILGIIANFIQKKSDIYSSNELFGLLSLLLLIQISDIFKASLKLPESKNQQTKQSSLGNITGLLSQLQGSGDNNNLQQMLPMLMGALGGSGGNNNLNMNNIASLLKNLNTGKKTSQENNEEEYEDEEDIENTQEIPDKKKVVGR
jgi:hypothetical protein